MTKDNCELLTVNLTPEYSEKLIKLIKNEPTHQNKSSMIRLLIDRAYQTSVPSKRR
jgi:hypothetical protein